MATAQWMSGNGSMSSFGWSGGSGLGGRPGPGDDIEILGGTITLTADTADFNSLTISSGAALALAGFDFNVTGPGGINNSGTITSSGASTLAGGSGGITNLDTLNVTDGTLTVTGAALTNSGAMTISAGATLSTSSALSNDSTRTITVYGTLTETGDDSISNSGTIALAGGTLSDTGGGGINNWGTITSSGTSALAGGSGGVTNLDILNVTSGTLTVTGALENNGAMTISAGATLSTNSSLSNDPDCTITLYGTLTETGDGTVSNSGTIALAGGTLSDTGGGGINNWDTITSSGTSLLAGGSGGVTNLHILNVTSGTLTVTGTLENKGSMTISTGATLTTNSALNNETGHTITIYGTVNETGTFDIKNSGTIELVNGALNHPGTGVSGDGAESEIENWGTITSTGTSSVGTGSGGLLNYNTLDVIDGTLTVTGNMFNFTNSTLSISSGTTFSISGALTNTFGCQIIIDGSLTATGSGALSNAGTITLVGGSTLSDPTGGISNTGAITGAGTITGVLTGSGTVTAGGGTLEFTSAVDPSGAVSDFHIAAGAALKFDAAVGTSSIHPTITFDATTGTLDLTGLGANEQNAFYAVIYGFTDGDKIIFAGAQTEDAETFSAVYDPITDTTSLTCKDGDVIDAVLVFQGNFSASVFHLAENGSGLDILTICFMAGTLVRTPDGEMAVESLARGDLVVSHDGRTLPVSWLGRQTVSTIFGDPLRILPIRIRAGALDENVPARDLLLSPDHALLIDGALIQAGALVNGTSILREAGVPTVFTYYHVELDDHSLILAENTPAETFIDNVNRLAFDNWHEHQELYPDGKTITELPYPRAKAHRQVPRAIQTKLAERARAIDAQAAVMAA